MPAPVGPDDGDGVAGLDDEVHVVDERHVRQVAERDVVEHDLAGGVLDPLRLGHVGDLLRLVEQLEGPLGGGHGRLDDVEDAGRLDDRLGELARVLHEGLHVAQRQLPGGDPQAADDGHADVVEVGDEAHRRLDDAGDELGPVAGVVELLVLLLERLQGLLLAAEDGHDGVPGVHLLDVPVERAGDLPLGGELLLRALGDERGDDDRGRHGEQRDDRQLRADEHHHHEHADDGQDRRDELREALLERLADVVDVVGDAAQDVAARVAVEVLERQPAQLLVDVGRAADRPSAGSRRP